MIQRLVSTLLCLAAAVEVSAFSTTHNPLSVQTKRLSPVLRSSAESVVDTSEDTDDVTCFVVNDEEIITEGEKPHVVCTSEPDDVRRSCQLIVYAHNSSFYYLPASLKITHISFLFMMMCAVCLV